MAELTQLSCAFSHRSRTVCATRIKSARANRPPESMTSYVKLAWRGRSGERERERWAQEPLRDLPLFFLFRNTHGVFFGGGKQKKKWWVSNEKEEKEKPDPDTKKKTFSSKLEAKVDAWQVKSEERAQTAATKHSRATSPRTLGTWLCIKTARVVQGRST